MPSPWPQATPGEREHRACADAERASYWLARLGGRDADAPLESATDAELCIVGGGFTGLWAALHAKRDDPARDVVVLEARSVGFGASGRNGGFFSPSLTHGLANGLSRFADELDALELLARENLDGFLADLGDYEIDCDLEQTGELAVALEPHELTWLAEEAALARRFGHDVQIFDAEQMRAEVASPLYRGGLWSRDGGGLLDPAKLVEGLRAAAVARGVRIYENTPVLRIAGAGPLVEVRTANGRVRASKVLLGTSAYPPLVRAIQRYVAPVYDYVLVSEPLKPEQRASLGWERRQGLADSANQFHYYRLTADDRLLWGGYDAVYRFGGPVAARHDDSPAVFEKLAQHLFTTFPQLEGLRFAFRWGGAIDTCSRFSVFFGSAHRGRVVYAVGYTGLGVGATRFGARVALDLLEGRETAATRLRYVRSRPVPFPPEPLRSGVIQLTRNRLAAADRRAGRRGIWLRLLDRLGLGFDS